jgi:transcriptional regulator with XRE-family HTH domain
VPRKNPVPESVRTVCARFLAAREAAGLTREEMAQRCRCDSERLRSYEIGRAAVPFWIGQRIAYETDHCQRWLATGRRPRKPFLPIDSEVELIVPKTMTFADAYAALFADEFDEWIAEYAKADECTEEDLEKHCEPQVLCGHPDDTIHAIHFRLNKLRTSTIFSVFPPQLRDRILKDYDRIWTRYMKKFRSEINEYRRSAHAVKSQRAQENAQFFRAKLRQWEERSKGK